MYGKIIILLISLIVMMILLQNKVSVWWFIGFLVITIFALKFTDSD